MEFVIIAGVVIVIAVIAFVVMKSRNGAGTSGAGQAPVDRVAPVTTPTDGAAEKAAAEKAAAERATAERAAADRAAAERAAAERAAAERAAAERAAQQAAAEKAAADKAAAERALADKAAAQRMAAEKAAADRAAAEQAAADAERAAAEAEQRAALQRAASEAAQQGAAEAASQIPAPREIRTLDPEGPKPLPARYRRNNEEPVVAPRNTALPRRVANKSLQEVDEAPVKPVPTGDARGRIGDFRPRGR